MTFSHEHQRVVHNNDKRMIKMVSKARDRKTMHRDNLLLLSFAQNRNGARKYTAIWLILQTAYALLSEQKTVTQVH